MAAGAVPQIGDGPACIDMAAPLLYSKTAERWKMPQRHPGSSLSRGLLPRILFCNQPGLPESYGVSMAIKNGDTLRVHYTGTLSDGTVFDSSREREPLEFTMGKGMLIPGFEAAVMGHEAGETVTVTIPPSQAYGESDPELVFTVDRAQVPDHIPLTVGVPLQLSNEQGQMDVTITEVTDEEITLDANHPLAGKELTFEIEIVSVN